MNECVHVASLHLIFSHALMQGKVPHWGFFVLLMQVGCVDRGHEMYNSSYVTMIDSGKRSQIYVCCSTRIKHDVYIYTDSWYRLILPQTPNNVHLRYVYLHINTDTNATTKSARRRKPSDHYRSSHLANHACIVFRSSYSLENIRG